MSEFLRSAKIVGLPLTKMFNVVGLGIAMAICEAGGVMMMLPALEFIQSKGELNAATASSLRWRVLDASFAFVNSRPSLAGLLVIAFAAILARQVMQYVQRLYTSRVRNGLTNAIRYRLFSGILAADIGTIEREATGRLVNDFTIEAETAVTTLAFTLQMIITSGICLVYLAALFLLSPAMTAWSLGLMLITALAVRGLINRTDAIGIATTAANQGSGTFLVERLQALRLIRLSGTEKSEFAHARSLMDEQTLQRNASEKIVAQLASTVEPLFIGFAFFCLWFGSVYLGLSLEALGIFLVIILRLVPIGKDLLAARQIVMHTKASLHCIEDRLEELQQARESGGGKREFCEMIAALQFQNVKFSYDSATAAAFALDDISFTLPANRTTAIVGPSGGGKSTMIDLLPKLRRPQSGQILIDDIPLDEFSLLSLRAGIAFVPQTPQIFDVTAAEHIRYGRPDATDDEIKDAARLANAYNFISKMPNGFHTRLGEGGSRLSGGQRQRLDLARALARRSPILVLDEPTSALDAESTKAFQDALDAIKKTAKTTIIIISHQIATIANVDQIVVLEAGKISDCGSHEALISRSGWYAAAWASQSHVSPPDERQKLLKAR